MGMDDVVVSAVKWLWNAPGRMKWPLRVVVTLFVGLVAIGIAAGSVNEVKKAMRDEAPAKVAEGPTVGPITGPIGGLQIGSNNTMTVAPFKPQPRHLSPAMREDLVAILSGKPSRNFRVLALMTDGETQEFGREVCAALIRADWHEVSGFGDAGTVMAPTDDCVMPMPRLLKNVHGIAVLAKVNSPGGDALAQWFISSGWPDVSYEMLPRDYASDVEVEIRPAQ